MVSRMGAMDIKRCPHCVGRLTVVELHEPDDFDARGLALICRRCDSGSQQDEPLFLPHAWDT